MTPKQHTRFLLTLTSDLASGWSGVTLQSDLKAEPPTPTPRSVQAVRDAAPQLNGPAHHLSTHPAIQDASAGGHVDVNF